MTHLQLRCKVFSVLVEAYADRGKMLTGKELEELWDNAMSMADIMWEDTPGTVPQ